MTTTKSKPTVISMKIHEKIVADYEEKLKNTTTKFVIPKILIEAINYYANKDNYRLIKSFTHHYRIVREGGKLAREVLDVISN